MDESSSDSDYQVEEFIQAKRVRPSVNDDTADLLGNFDDVKRKEILDGTYIEPEIVIQNPSDSDDSAHDVEKDDESDDENTKTNKKVVSNEGNNNAMSDGASDSDDEDDDDEESSNEINTNLSKAQLTSLLRGASKANRHVLYVTNLNFETQKEDLEAHFSVAGSVKSVRIPKQRRGGFAFVEMTDIESFQRGFQLHNSELQGRKIKVQISEAGKKKSANKKNIIKQKNRKLAEMRNEQKTFTKSGKFYDKTLKKEKAKEMLARKRWRKPAGLGGGMANK